MDNTKSLFELVGSYITAAGPKKKEMLDDILAFPNAERRIFDIVYSDDQRAALRTLADACKRKASREVITPLVIRDADKLLAIPDAKARKTTFGLMGSCAPDALADKLLAALQAEQTRFVRPSIILALGNTEDPGKFLRNYAVEPGEEKHVREESAALKKALSKTMARPENVSFKLPAAATLTSINKKALISELTAHGVAYEINTVLPDAFDVPSGEIEKLRCYDEALFYVGSTHALKPVAIKLHDLGCRGLAYRIEAGRLPTDERRSIIETLSAGLAKYGYHDNPSSYSFEIRVAKNALFVSTLKDNRFAYRKQSISASINPATAACVMQLIKPCMKDNADVLDPFCGSAVMLIERSLAKKTNSLVGVDTSPVAIKAALANRKASGLKIALIKGDILGYGASKYDEIIANMPFGIRVGDHESNVKLYGAFIVKMDSLLKPDGVAFLYTQEKKLLRSIIAENSGFTIEKQLPFESGGLSPTLFIIRRSQ